MSVRGRLLRRLLGGEVDPAIRPLLAVQALGSFSGSMVWVFVGVWALDRLHASHSGLGIAYALAAILGAATGFLGGQLSDRVGRRIPILVGRSVFTLVLLGAIAVGDHALPGLLLLVANGSLGSLGDAADQALVADLVPPEGREEAYAALRVVANAGVSIGPPIGGLLIGVGWNALFAVAATIAAVNWVLAYRVIPARGRYSSEHPARSGSWRVIVADRPFLLLLVASSLAWMTYVAYDALMPVSLVTRHGFATVTWGLIMIANPIGVALFQLRVTRLTARYDARPRLTVAMLLMGLPLIVLTFADQVLVVIAIVLVFVLGEMIWVPAMMGVAAASAPADRRGAYMGAFGATGAVGWALSPLVGFQVLQHGGDAAMWFAVGGLSVVAAVVFPLALRNERWRPDTTFNA